MSENEYCSPQRASRSRFTLAHLLGCASAILRRVAAENRRRPAPLGHLNGLRRLSSRAVVVPSIASNAAMLSPGSNAEVRRWEIRVPNRSLR